MTQMAGMGLVRLELGCYDTDGRNGISTARAVGTCTGWYGMTRLVCMGVVWLCVAVVLHVVAVVLYGLY